jgi:hypothetical protein
VLPSHTLLTMQTAFMHHQATWATSRPQAALPSGRAGQCTSVCCNTIKTNACSSFCVCRLSQAPSLSSSVIRSCWSIMACPSAATAPSMQRSCTHLPLHKHLLMC